MDYLTQQNRRGEGQEFPEQQVITAEDVFAIPPGGQCIASSEHCAHQVFAMDKHLGMQCHVEMTAELIRSWCDDWHKEVASLAARTASVQTPEEMQRDVDSRVEALNRVAERLYDRWIEGLAR